MTWLALVMLIIKVIVALPDIIEQIKKWLDLFRRVPAPKQFRERGAFGKALKAALEQKEQMVDGPCPVTSYVADMENRFGMAAA